MRASGEQYYGRHPSYEYLPQHILTEIEDRPQAATHPQGVKELAQQAEWQSVGHRVDHARLSAVFHEAVFVVPETIRADALFIDEEGFLLQMGDLGEPGGLHARDERQPVFDQLTGLHGRFPAENDLELHIGRCHGVQVGRCGEEIPHLIQLSRDELLSLQPVYPWQGLLSLSWDARQGLRPVSQTILTHRQCAETYVLVRCTGGHAQAIRFLRSLRGSPRLLKVWSDAVLESRAEALLERHADQDLSFTDAVSFVVMQDRGIAEAFSYDKHFVVMGFGRVAGDWTAL